MLFSVLVAGITYAIFRPYSGHAINLRTARHAKLLPGVACVCKMLKLALARTSDPNRPTRRGPGHDPSTSVFNLTINIVILHVRTYAHPNLIRFRRVSLGFAPGFVMFRSASIYVHRLGPGLWYSIQTQTVNIVL